MARLAQHHGLFDLPGVVEAFIQPHRQLSPSIEVFVPAPSTGKPIITYGFDDEGQHLIAVRLTMEADGAVSIEVKDDGKLAVIDAQSCRACGICASDYKAITGMRTNLTFPFIPGHEWAGEIASLGPGADRYGWKVGDRVAGTSHDACGVCQKCVEGRYNLCENYGRAGLHRQYGHNAQGADATYVVHGIKSIFPLPPAVKAAAALAVLPRPNQAYWTLSAMWSGWLWGIEAVAPLHSALERIRRSIS